MIPGGIHPLLLAGGASVRVQDVFATSLYTGNGGTQTLTDGIDRVGHHVLDWFKERAPNARPHRLVDSRRGKTKTLQTASTAAEDSVSAVSSYLSNGLTLNSDSLNAGFNTSGESFVKWSFREAPDFFGIVTYTGDGVAGRQVDISHLGFTKAPGMVVVKRLDSTSGWPVYHRSIPATDYLLMNSTAAKAASATLWNDTAPTAATVTLGTAYNASGGTYVMYVFGHNVDPDGLIQAFSYTGTGSGSLNVINLNWKPQAVLVKPSSATGSWWWFDGARSPTDPRNKGLAPNTSNPEASGSFFDFSFTSTGVTTQTSDSTINGLSVTYVGLAIRAPS